MKVLLISHNPITTYHNMGKTLLSLFSSFKKEELCQLYIYPTLPDTDRCSSYYRITDKNILKSYTSFFRVKGCEIDKSLINEANTMFSEESDRQIYHNKKNKLPLRMLARDLMWKFSSWYNNDLKQWLLRESPDCIFVAPGTAKFLYDIALKISRRLNIPIIMYVCDDYYFIKEPNGLLGKIRLSLLKKKIEKLLSKASHIITICDEIKDLYNNRFKIPATTIMTGTNYPIAQSYADTVADTITYMGNIRCKRYKSLAALGHTLDDINRKHNTNHKLKIYSNEKDKSILSSFNNIDSIQFCGYVQGEEFDKVFRSSHLLLHVEAFDNDSIDLVKHSVSTKIADSLASGIPLLAYAPDYVSSMKHLMRNNCALCANEEKALENILVTAFCDGQARKKAVENAIETAKKYHNRETNSKCLYHILDIIVKNRRLYER